MKYIYNFLIRYLLLFIPISFFEFFLAPITIYGTYVLLYFLNPKLITNILIIDGIPFTFIDACIAVYAYYLIWFLTLTTKDIKLITRVKMILIGFILILIMNYLRIILLIILTLKVGFVAFNTTHLIFWKFLSWIYVFLVWIILIKLFNIKVMPIYDDLKYLYKRSLFKRH